MPKGMGGRGPPLPALSVGGSTSQQKTNKHLVLNLHQRNRRDLPAEALLPPRIQVVMQPLQRLLVLLGMIRHDTAHQVLSARVKLALLPQLV